MPPLPPLNLNLANSSRSGDAVSGGGNSSMFSGNSYGMNIPPWVWAAGLVIGVILLKR